MMCALCPKVFVTCDDTLHVGCHPNLTLVRMVVNDTANNFFLKKIVKYILLNFQLLLYLILNNRNIDTVIFYDLYGASFILSKLLRKKTIIFRLGNPEQTIKFVYTNPAFKRLVCALIKTQFTLVKIFADLLISDSSKNLLTIQSGNSVVSQYRYIKDIFRISTPFSERNLCIGYIGRFSAEKGFENLLASIPALLSMNNKIQIMLVGDGPLRPKIKEYIDPQLLTRVQILGWVAPSMVAFYLNKMRLIVVPSYTEGLPMIIIEAMACGTPVLSTPVGEIPNIIKDCKTGFILENNSPECIAQNVIRALNHPNLEQITQNARALVEREFTFEKAVERYRKILSDVSKKY